MNRTIGAESDEKGGLSAEGRGPRRWIAAYYLASPVFALLDLGLGLNIRLAALEGLTILRVGYYLVCLSLGVLAWMRPRLEPLTALGESAVNLVLLFAGMMAAYAGMLDSVLQGDLINPFTPTYVFNFGLSGGVMVTGFHARMARFGAAAHSGEVHTTDGNARE